MMVGLLCNSLNILARTIPKQDHQPQHLVAILGISTQCKSFVEALHGLQSNLNSPREALPLGCKHHFAKVVGVLSEAEIALCCMVVRLNGGGSVEKSGVGFGHMEEMA